MKNLGLVMQYLYPQPFPPQDWVVQDDGAGPYLAKFDESKLGPRPTSDFLASREAEALAAPKPKTLAQRIAALEAKIKP